MTAIEDVCFIDAISAFKRSEFIPKKMKKTIDKKGGIQYNITES